jgi:hypothetical protein
VYGLHLFCIPKGNFLDFVVITNSLPRDALFQYYQKASASGSRPSSALGDKLQQPFSAMAVSDTNTADIQSNPGSDNAYIASPLSQSQTQLTDLDLTMHRRCLAYIPTLASSGSTISSTVGSPPSPQYCVRVNSVAMFVEVNRLMMKLAGTRVAPTVETSDKTQIGMDSMVGEGTKMGDRCSVKKSVIGAHCTIGKNVKIVNSIILDYVTLEDKYVFHTLIISIEILWGFFWNSVELMFVLV